MRAGCNSEMQNAECIMQNWQKTPLWINFHRGVMVFILLYDNYDCRERPACRSPCLVRHQLERHTGRSLRLFCIMHSEFCINKQKAASPERNAVIFAAMDHTARSTLLERRHLVQAYTWHGVPLTTALTRLTLGLTARLERLWEWETLIPKVTPLPQ